MIEKKKPTEDEILEVLTGLNKTQRALVTIMESLENFSKENKAEYYVVVRYPLKHGGLKFNSRRSKSGKMALEIDRWVTKNFLLKKVEPKK